MFSAAHYRPASYSSALIRFKRTFDSTTLLTENVYGERMETVALLGITLWLLLFWGLIGCCYFWFNCLLTWENDGVDEKDVPKQLALLEQARLRRESNLFRARSSTDSTMILSSTTSTPKETKKILSCPKSNIQKSYGSTASKKLMESFREETSTLLSDIDETMTFRPEKINLL